MAYGGGMGFVCFLCFVQQVLVLCPLKINICSENNNFCSFDKPSHFYVSYTTCHNVLLA